MAPVAPGPRAPGRSGATSPSPAHAPALDRSFAFAISPGIETNGVRSKATVGELRERCETAGRGAERRRKRLPSCSTSVSFNESRSARISGQEVLGAASRCRSRIDNRLLKLILDSRLSKGRGPAAFEWCRNQVQERSAPRPTATPTACSANVGSTSILLKKSENRHSSKVRICSQNVFQTDGCGFKYIFSDFDSLPGRQRNQSCSWAFAIPIWLR
jgi:hypothetical protein